MKVMVTDHQGKSAMIQSSLADRGCELVSDPLAADVILIDHDIPSHGRVQLLEACVAAGGRGFIYPHGAGPKLLTGWDGVYPVSPLLSGLLATGPGYAELGRRFGYPHPIHNIGWTFCEQRPRIATGRIEHVVFAPIHPDGNGYLRTWLRERNLDIFNQLRATPVRLTVRHIGSLAANGLPQVEGVEYLRGQFGDLDDQLALVDSADVVVDDCGTFSCLAVARGVTAIMFGSTETARSDQDPTITAKSPELYREYIGFPFEAREGIDIWELMQAAAQDEDLVGDWRARFIGEPFDGDRLLEVLQGDGAHLTPQRRSARLHQASLASFSRGESASADALLTEAITLTLDLELLNDLAVVRSRGGELEVAKQLLGASLAIDPARGDAAENLAALQALAARPAVASKANSWRRSSTLGGPDPHMPERAFPGMPSAGTMSEHAIRYGLALGQLGGKAVLDLGCGTGYGSEMLTWSAASVQGFDLWRPDESERPAWPGGAVLTYGHNLCTDPLPRADAAVMYEVIEHLDDAPAALRFAWNAVDFLIASFPNPVFHGSHHNHYHVNDWTLEQFEHELVQAAATRFAHVELQHAHQTNGGIIIPERDPEGSFWIVLARGTAPIRNGRA
jgi:hypothetical protein